MTFEPLKMAKQKHNNKTKGGKKRNTVNKINFVIETTNQKKKIVGITTHTLSPILVCLIQWKYPTCCTMYITQHIYLITPKQPHTTWWMDKTALTKDASTSIQHFFYNPPPPPPPPLTHTHTHTHTQLLTSHLNRLKPNQLKSNSKLF